MNITKKAYAELKRKGCDLDTEIRGRSKLIKLLKCCGNCHRYADPSLCPQYSDVNGSDMCDKWELRETEETDKG